MAAAQFRMRLWRWFSLRAFGRTWVVYSLPDCAGEWGGLRPRLAWEGAYVGVRRRGP